MNESQSDIGSLKSSVESLFDGNYNETWNATLNQFDAFVSNLSFYLSCFESDKFVGKHTFRVNLMLDIFLFYGNYNETWNATENQLHTFVANQSFYLSCFKAFTRERFGHYFSKFTNILLHTQHEWQIS